MCVGGTLPITPITILFVRGTAEERFSERDLKNYMSVSAAKRNFGSIQLNCAVHRITEW